MTSTTKLSIVADYQDLCGECPVWDPRGDALYWTDCVGQRFYRFHPASGKHEILKQGLEINGYRLNRKGGFVITNNSGIWLWDGRDQLELIAAEVDGVKCQMNDCTADPAGRLYAGSQHYDPTGKAGVSLDHSTLYFADSVARRIYAYDDNVNTGDLRCAFGNSA